MPVAGFPGRWNWGYDGVDLYAPASVYGGPSGLKRLIDAAHRVGLGVLLDVVYNHFGPDGNYLRAYSDDYFTDRYATPWGEAVNYDGQRSRWVRQFIRENVRYWLDEYHLDGLRLDATHAIFDNSPRQILAELAESPTLGSGRRCSSPRTTATWFTWSTRQSAAATVWTASGRTTFTTRCEPS